MAGGAFDEDAPRPLLLKLLTDHLEAITAFVRENLPAKYRRRMAGPVRPLDTALLDKKALSRIHCDCILEVPLTGGESLYILLEHKSYWDPEALLQLAGYTLHFQAYLMRRDGTPAEALPLVIPMLLYHGRRKWDIPSSIGRVHRDSKVVCGVEVHCLAIDLTRRPLRRTSRHPYARAIFAAMLAASGAIEGDDALLQVARLLERQLRKKFGEVSAPYRQRLGQASPEQLDAWGERLLEVKTLNAVFKGGPSTR